MKWKKVSEHPLPEGDGVKFYIVRFYEPTDFCITKLPIIHASASEWCEFNPDEIESCDSMVDKVRHKLNQDPLSEQLKESIQKQINEMPLNIMKEYAEPSWEEKFRRKTARKVLLDFINHGYATKESFAELVVISVKNTDLLIAELKRKKEWE